MASRNTTNWKGGSPKARLSPCRPSLSRVTRMGHHIQTPVPMPRNSQANMRTGTLTAASGTICLRKRRRPLPKLSLTWTLFDRVSPAQAQRTEMSAVRRAVRFRCAEAADQAENAYERKISLAHQLSRRTTTSSLRVTHCECEVGSM